ncbi:MAG: ComF family protein [Chlorobi bacterium]|nr:ComF family protein [Chlorobiota bacterium]MCI0716573.1 ComF family protein [Chlorobiota bacterium]
MFRRTLNRVLDEIVNFVLPNSCLCCESPIAPDERFICMNCFKKLEKFGLPHPWKEEFIAKSVIDNSLSAFWFREGTAIQTLLHCMKYEKMKSVGRMLGNQIGRQIAELNGMTFDYVVPVPLHKARIRDRQYNQSEFIAKGMSEVLNAKVLNDALIRIRYTQTQTKLNKAERKENVKGAFEVNQKHKDKITAKNIIVVDDVITTGATILECAEVLKKSGAGKIWVCSAAYAALD